MRFSETIQVTNKYIILKLEIILILLYLIQKYSKNLKWSNLKIYKSK